MVMKIYDEGYVMPKNDIVRTFFNIYFMWKIYECLIYKDS